MNVKVHFLYSQLDYFLESLGKLNEKQRKRFHKDLQNNEKKIPRKIEHKHKFQKLLVFKKRLSANCTYCKSMVQV